MEILGFTIAPIVIFLVARAILRGLWELSEPLRDELKRKCEDEKQPRQ